jgi:hypothetical protein
LSSCIQVPQSDNNQNLPRSACTSSNATTLRDSSSIQFQPSHVNEKQLARRLAGQGQVRRQTSATLVGARAPDQAKNTSLTAEKLHRAVAPALVHSQHHNPSGGSFTELPGGKLQRAPRREAPESSPAGGSKELPGGRLQRAPRREAPGSSPAGSSRELPGG